MLDRSNRLLNDKDFARIFAKGKFASTAAVTLKAVPNGLPKSRFGFVVGTKVSKRAVERNKAKRRMREIIRKNAKFIKGGYDLVFVAKKDALTTEYKALEQMMASATDRLGLLQR